MKVRNSGTAAVVLPDGTMVPGNGEAEVKNMADFKGHPVVDGWLKERRLVTSGAGSPAASGEGEGEPAGGKSASSESTPAKPAPKSKAKAKAEAAAQEKESKPDGSSPSDSGDGSPPPASDDEGPRAEHKGGGTYAVVYEGAEIKMTKTDAEAFNGLPPEDKAAYLQNKRNG